MDDDELLDEVRAALGVSVLTPLVAGGQKRVYRAALQGVPVVVKIVPIPDTAYGAEVTERARREVELLSEVESDYVVRVLSEAVEVGERPEAVCWVEEFLDGQDLRDLVHTYPWEAQAVWTLLHDVAAGLAACHELQVVHRDLSPGNVRRRASGRFTVMDPGFARHLAKAALTGEYQPGTPGYLTPEHVPGGKPITGSDMFALGILAFQAITGALPVPYSGDEASYYMQLRTQQVPSISSMRGDVDHDLAAVVDRCLQRQPARRFLDAMELLEDQRLTQARITDRGKGAER